jgi:phosphoadenosine phosphosulfate reductase
MTNTRQKNISDLLDQIGGLSIEESLHFLTHQFPGQVCFSTSFSQEDQVITHTILSAKIPVSIFTLDTGRLFAETYSVWSSTNERYNTRVLAYNPDRNILEDYQRKEKDINCWNGMRIML